MRGAEQQLNRVTEMNPSAKTYIAISLVGGKDEEKVDPSQLGDVTMLPHEFPLSSADEIARAFGNDFAQQLARLQHGRWAGPVTSGYGLHLVYVRERTGGGRVRVSRIGRSRSRGGSRTR